MNLSKSVVETLSLSIGNLEVKWERNSVFAVVKVRDDVLLGSIATTAVSAKDLRGLAEGLLSLSQEMQRG